MRSCVNHDMPICVHVTSQSSDLGIVCWVIVLQTVDPEEIENEIARQMQEAAGGQKREVMSTPCGKPSPSPQPAKKRSRPDGAAEVAEAQDTEQKLLANDEVLQLALQGRLGSQSPAPQCPMKPEPCPMTPSRSDVYEVLESPLMPRKLQGTPLQQIMDAETQFATPLKGADSFPETLVERPPNNEVPLKTLKDLIMQASPTTAAPHSPGPDACSDPYGGSDSMAP